MWVRSGQWLLRYCNLNFKAIHGPLGGWVGGGGWLVKSDFIALFGHPIG